MYLLCEYQNFTLYISKRLLFKGALFGTTVWFILFSLHYLLQLPDLREIPLKTAVSHVISSALWGIALASQYLSALLTDYAQSPKGHALKVIRLGDAYFTREASLVLAGRRNTKY